MAFRRRISPPPGVISLLVGKTEGSNFGLAVIMADRPAAVIPEEGGCLLCTRDKGNHCWQVKTHRFVNVYSVTMNMVLIPWSQSTRLDGRVLWDRFLLF